MSEKLEHSSGVAHNEVFKKIVYEKMMNSILACSIVVGVSMKRNFLSDE